jgi:integrase
MTLDTSVRLVVMGSGERLPLLVDRASGEPLYLPTIYALTTGRMKGRATSTIGQSLRAIGWLIDFLKSAEIDLEARLLDGRFLLIHEIDRLARHCRRRGQSGELAVQKSVVRPLTKPVSRKAEVSSEVAGTRIAYIANYLQWWVDYTVRNRRLDRQQADSFAKITARALLALRERGRSGKKPSSPRRGLTREQQAVLEDMIHPTSPRNPWKSEVVKARNALMIRWWLDLGLRRGELLGVSITDIDFRQNEVHILRRADDPDDPRREQPNAKTLARVLPINRSLAAETHTYITRIRNQSNAARRHGFLFVERAGAPISLDAVNKLFVELRQASAGELPADLSPHVLRHTWNDRFSDIADEKRIPEERERRQREYLMGWRVGSNAAATYTKRSTERRAAEASLLLQTKGRGTD